MIKKVLQPPFSSLSKKSLQSDLEGKENEPQA